MEGLLAPSRFRLSQATKVDNLFDARKNYVPWEGGDVLKKWTHAAQIGLSCGETVQFVQQYLEVPLWLDKTTSWMSNSAEAYLGCQGLAQEWEVRGLKPKKKGGENLHSWMLMALYISYIFQGTWGMLQLRCGESFSKNQLFARCQFMGVCAINILPLARDIFEFLYTQQHNPDYPDHLDNSQTPLDTQP